MEVIARIDTGTPSGRKIARELEKKKAVKMEYPLPDSISGNLEDNTEEVFDNLLDKLNDHYGTDYKF
ncbi:MAG: hypothetical protein GX102_15335 [Porphyromonadaceae bacterium]|nr:hypothetical protein [Porphyromonadaceae bacterium]